MAYEQKDNSGSVFPNERKREGKNDADLTGQAMVGGVEYWVNGWGKKTKDGRKWLSLSFRPKAAMHPGGGERSAPAEHEQVPEGGDGLPF
jgi:hypothetical protein